MEFLEFLFNWEKSKDRVFPELINYEAHEEALRMLVHRKFGDMAIVYKLEVRRGSESSSFIRVTHTMLENFGISGKELYEKAIENLEKAKGEVFTLDEAAKKVMQELGIEEMPNPPINNFMRIIADAELNGRIGAAYILDKKLLDKAAEELNQDTILLIPSSAGEVIATLPEIGSEAIRGNMEEVNTSGMIEEEEIISYIPYEYNRITKNLRAVR